LQFGADGKLVEDAKVGPWTVDGQVEVKSVVLVDRTLKIQGRRVWLFFDPFRRQFRDIASVRPGDKTANLFCPETWKEVADHPVEIDLELASDFPDCKEISLAMEAIFLNPSESLVDVIPGFWRSYFAEKNGETQAESEFSEDSNRVGDGVSAPKPLEVINPQFSEAARQAGFGGTITLSLVVDKDGNPKDIQVVDPAGLGLEEESVEAAQHWKFRPGQKEARPVNVQIQVETGFNLVDDAPNR
jgi:TonB family protein